MRQLVRSGSCTGMLLVLAAAATTHAQNPPPAKAATPPAKAATAATAPARPIPPPAVLNQVLATVNGESITRSDLLKFLSGYEIPAGNEENIYRDAMETLVNNRLVNSSSTARRSPSPSRRSMRPSPRSSRT